MAPSFERGRKKYENKRKLSAADKEIVKFPSKAENQKRKVSDLVYEYLGQVANVHNRKKRRNNARSNFHRTHVRKPPGNIYPKRHNTKNQRTNSIFNINLPKKISYIPLTNNSTFSEIRVPSISKNIAKDYAKAVNEGRNIARKYICKALSFGVHSGFLIPTDDRGQMLRVSSSLCLFEFGKNIKVNPILKKQSKPTEVKKINRKILKKSRNPKNPLKKRKTVRFRGIKKESKKRKHNNKAY